MRESLRITPAVAPGIADRLFGQPAMPKALQNGFNEVVTDASEHAAVG